MADEKSLPDNTKQSSVVRQSDVTEIYLANRGLQEVESFQKYKNLQRLWLNGNKLRRINCLLDNFCITEVYLQDNLLIDITGVFSHLGGLEILMLQGNQLKNLTDVVHELRKMPRLRVLNLFGNPLAQDYDYRNYVIHNIASLALLDRKEILKVERDKSQRRYGDAVSERIKDTLAFGRRVTTTENTNDDGINKTQWENPRLLGSSLDRQQAGTSLDNSSVRKTPSCQDENNQRGPNFSGKMPRRSLMEYSSFDWSSVPLSEQRRLSGVAPNSCPKVVRMYIR